MRSVVTKVKPSEEDVGNLPPFCWIDLVTKMEPFVENVPVEKDELKYKSCYEIQEIQEQRKSLKCEFKSIYFIIIVIYIKSLLRL